MHYVRSIFSGFFLVLFAFVCTVPVFAEPVVSDDPDIFQDFSAETAPSPGVVTLDPEQMQSILDALQPTEMDVPEPTTPMVDISPGSIDALVEGIGSAVSENSTLSDGVEIDESYNGYYIVIDCALGKGIKIPVPVEFAVDKFAISDDGHVTNMSVNKFETVLRIGMKRYEVVSFSMCDFSYREVSGLSGGVVQYYDLNETVVDSNISFLHNTPKAISPSVYWIVLIAVCLLGFLLVGFLKR